MPAESSRQAQPDLVPTDRPDARRSAGAGLLAAVRGLRLVRWPAVLIVLFGIVPYGAARGVADDVGVPRQSLTIDLEALSVAGPTWSGWLQDLLYSADALSAFDLFLVAVYTAWFPVAAAVVVYVAGWQWHRFGFFALTWFVLFYGALIPFALFPTEPPWMAYDVTRILHVAGRGVLKIDPNPVAAMPSLHVGLPAMLAIWTASIRLRRTSIALGVFTALTGFAVVYLGEHYVLDVVAGVAFAWGVVRLSDRLARSIGRLRGGATPPIDLAERQDVADRRAA